MLTVNIVNNEQLIIDCDLWPISTRAAVIDGLVVFVVTWTAACKGEGNFAIKGNSSTIVLILKRLVL